MTDAPVLPGGTIPGRHLGIGFKTSPQGVDWGTLDATWAAAGELDVFDAGWMNDHLTDLSEDGGPSYESLTLLATLAGRVPGRWVGHGVLSNTFRHPAVLAKAATVLDHATGGRFVLGLGAGWHEREHAAFGIPLPGIGERIDRLASALGVLESLFSPAAGTPPGVTRPDPFYPLERAVHLPAPLTPGGPPIWLGGQRARGIALAVRHGSGWFLPGANAGDVDYFADRREAILRAFDAAGRDASTFVFAGQVSTGRTARDRAAALESARGLVARGANHLILGVAPALGPENLVRVAREIAEPLRGDPAP